MDGWEAKPACTALQNAQSTAGCLFLFPITEWGKGVQRVHLEGGKVSSFLSVHFLFGIDFAGSGFPFFFTVFFLFEVPKKRP
jgi:hypothetical protein